MSARFARLVYRWRILLSVGFVAGALAFLPQIDINDIDNDLTAWFSRTDPAFQDYERFRQEFGGTRALIIAIEGDRIFTPEGLRFLRSVSGEIERVPVVDRVHSLATANVVRALPETTDEPGGLEIQPLIDRREDRNPADVRARALSDPLIRGELVSGDGLVTAIVVTFDEDRIDDVRAGVIEQIHQIIDPKLPPGLKAYYNGSIEISETYNRITLENQQRFIPPIMLLTMGALYAAFRSVKKTLVAVVTIGLSVAWTLGVYSLMGFSYNVLTSMIVPLVIVLAISDDVHIIQHYERVREATRDRQQSFESTVTYLLAPLLGASGTTALGMLSLATSDVVAVRTFGIGAAVGVMIDFALSIVFVPTVLGWLNPDPGKPPHELYLVRPLRAVSAFSTRHWRTVLVVSALIVMIASAGVLKLRVDTNHINFFSDRHPLHESAVLIDSKLAGVYSFQLFLEGPPDSMKSPGVLSRMDALEAELETLPYVRKVSSVTDYVKRINQELHDGAPSAAAIPAGPDVIAQELFVFSLSDEGRSELERMVSSDFSRAQISVKLASMSSDLVFEQVRRAESLARDVFEGTPVRATATGSGRLFSTLDHYLVESQMGSFATAFVTVFGVIFLIFKSTRYGLLAMVPNVFPVIAVLGVMGWLGISLNVATVMVASVALGVVDDDTIHFINRYRRDRADGLDADRAIEHATIYEGRAALTTTLINGAGFAVLMQSEYHPTAWFGGLLAITMAVAFLAEVFVLPATIKAAQSVLEPRRPRVDAAGVPTTGLVLLVLLGLAAGGTAAQAQTRPEGHVTVGMDYLPNAGDVGELRARVFAEEQIDAGEHVSFMLSGLVEGLISTRTEHSRDALARPQDLYVDVRFRTFDLRAGLARVAWGRLDELQPGDVINPLDVSRFLFEGRNEARLPVWLVRGRAVLPASLGVEAVFLPVFRRGRFDELAEESSPFRLSPDQVVCQGIGVCPLLAILRDEPDLAWRNVQGGLRVTGTASRLDWAVSAFSGMEPFALLDVAPSLLPPAPFIERFPRFTMIAGDVETVRGPWGIRGEAAMFLEDSFPHERRIGIVRGRSLDAGFGIDRRAGDYRLAANLIVRREMPDEGAATTDTTLVVASERHFARETRIVRTFAAYNLADESLFLRAIAGLEVRDNVWLEGSAGWFFGDGSDLIGRFSDKDFLHARLKVYF